MVGFFNSYHTWSTFLPVSVNLPIELFHDWCNKGRGMYYSVCRMVHIKEPLLLIDKSSLYGGSRFPFSLSEWSLRWHCTKWSDCQVRVRGAPWNVYGVNVTKAVIGAYMWQWWLVQILWHLPYVFSSFCCLMNYYTVTFATCWYMGWVKILQVTFCVNLTVATVNFL